MENPNLPYPWQMKDFDVVGNHCSINQWLEICRLTSRHPCRNNGTCVAFPDTYECQCDDTEFSGKIYSSFDTLKSTMLTFRTILNG